MVPRCRIDSDLGQERAVADSALRNRIGGAHGNDVGNLDRSCRPGCALIRRTNHLQRGRERAGEQREHIQQRTVRQQHDLIVEGLCSRSRIVENRRGPVRAIESAAQPRWDAACRVARNAIPNHVDGVAIGICRDRIAVVEVEGSGVRADAGVVDEHGRRIPTRAGAARAGRPERRCDRRGRDSCPPKNPERSHTRRRCGRS